MRKPVLVIILISCAVIVGLLVGNRKGSSDEVGANDPETITTPEFNEPTIEASPTFSRPEERGDDFSVLETSEVIRLLETSQDMIERRKAAKVLGDRNIAGTLNLSGEEEQAIQRSVGGYLEQVKASDSNVRAEARHQIERMWRIAVPTLLENATSRNSPVAETAIKSLILMRDESIVKALIEKAKSAEDEHAKARLIFTLKKMTEQRKSLIPGRECLKQEESAALYDRLIVPALAELQESN